MKIRGIYKIQSKTHPERIYIGSSENISKRFSNHKGDLLYNNHKNNKLQNHYNKYGLDDFIFELIEECTLEEKLNREQYYIDTLNPWFNILKIAGNTTGRVFSEETLLKLRNPSESAREKMRNSHKNRIYKKFKRPDGYISPLKGIKLTEEHLEKLRLSSKSKPIFQCDLDGTIIKEWLGVKTAAKSLNIYTSGIHRCLKGKNKTAYGFTWKYKD